MAERILIVDDELAITDLIASMLAYAGFEVIRAYGGLEALARIREERPDLVILDVMMPDLDGREVCRLLQADSELRPLPIVLCSSADEGDIPWAEIGASAFLQKPFNIMALPDLVRRVLGRSR